MYSRVLPLANWRIKPCTCFATCMYLLRTKVYTCWLHERAQGRRLTAHAHSRCTRYALDRDIMITCHDHQLVEIVIGSHIDSPAVREGLQVREAILGTHASVCTGLPKEHHGTCRYTYNVYLNISYMFLKEFITAVSHSTITVIGFFVVNLYMCSLTLCTARC